MKFAVLILLSFALDKGSSVYLKFRPPSDGKEDMQ